MSDYHPRGVLLHLLAAIAAQPMREFTAKECADIMRCEPRAVGSYTLYAVRAGLVFRRKDGRRVLFRGTAYEDSPAPVPHAKRGRKPRHEARDPMSLRAAPAPVAPLSADDPRIPRVVDGWRPPVMRCVRLGE